MYDDDAFLGYLLCCVFREAIDNDFYAVDKVLIGIFLSAMAKLRPNSKILYESSSSGSLERLTTLDFYKLLTDLFAV